jgi:hypothetical protein
MIDMAMAPDRLPTVAPADWVSGAKQGEWTYQSYAHIPDDGKRLESGEYRSLGVFRGKATLASRVVPGIEAVPVERFFV